MRPLLCTAGPVMERGPEWVRALRAEHGVPAERGAEAVRAVFAPLVGDTVMLRARNLGRELGIGELWLKFEGDSITGTQKDRIAAAHVVDAVDKGMHTITVATCGNYGVAVALMGQIAGVAVQVVIPEGYHTRRIDEMGALGAEVRRWPGSYEDAVEHSRDLARDNGWYDGNPGGENEAVQLRGYASIGREIVRDLGRAPAVVACSVSNGTTLAGAWVGLSSAGAAPRMVAGSAWHKNPIVTAFRQGLAHVPELPPDKVRETAVNEPLINWRSLDGDVCLGAIRVSGGFAADATDKGMTRMARLLREQQGLSVLPASTAGLIALARLNQREPLPSEPVVVIITGRNA